MSGGTGDDIYVVDSTSDTVTENDSEGTDLIQSSVSFTASSNVENLTLTGSRDINGTGNSLDNTLTGNSGDNTLDGDSGDDSMSGGTGDDIYVVDSTSDTVTESSSGGTDTIQSSVTYRASSNVENLSLTGSGNINGTGNSSANIIRGNSGANRLNGGAGVDKLFGNAGNDVLIGGSGIDDMRGGTGNDRYSVDNSRDVIREGSNQGTDLVYSSVTYRASSNVENLSLTGSGNINGTGNSSANIIRGNSGANRLNGGAGVDKLFGNAGNDVLIGGSGIDDMRGGTGNDRYSVDNSRDVIREGSNQGTDLVYSSVTYRASSNVENLSLTGSGNINGTGNSSANIIRGNSGANRLNGGAGVDKLFGNAGNDVLIGGSGIDDMRGGTGNDRYSVDNSRDVIREGSNQGTDLVYSSVTYRASSNVENLSLTGSGNINGTGNSSANIIRGNSGANRLNGGAGVDKLFGNAGNDVLIGGSGIDDMRGGTGNDRYSVDNSRDVIREGSNQGTDLVYSSVTYTASSNVENLSLTGSGNINGTGNSSANIIRGNSGANRLNGGAGNDRLVGGNGIDRLTGGVGNDTIIGGGGNDIFQINSGLGRDVITDYTPGKDRIKLLGGLAENDLTFSYVGGHTRIKDDEGDLLAIVKNIIADDLTFI